MTPLILPANFCTNVSMRRPPVLVLLHNSIGDQGASFHHKRIRLGGHFFSDHTGRTTDLCSEVLFGGEARREARCHRVANLVSAGRRIRKSKASLGWMWCAARSIGLKLHASAANRRGPPRRSKGASGTCEATWRSPPPFANLIRHTAEGKI